MFNSWSKGHKHITNRILSCQSSLNHLLKNNMTERDRIAVIWTFSRQMVTTATVQCRRTCALCQVRLMVEIWACITCGICSYIGRVDTWSAVDSVHRRKDELFAALLDWDLDFNCNHHNFDCSVSIGPSLCVLYWNSLFMFLFEQILGGM